MKELFNNGWYFHKEPLNTPVETFFTTEQWEAVDVPHDWMIYDTENLYEEAISCYKKSFTVDSSGTDRISLLFEGVYMNTTIYLNGKKIFYWPYGYSQFEADLTEHLIAGENTIYVISIYECPNSRWYPGSGIYRSVWFIRRPLIHLNTDGIYISPRKSGTGWELHIDTEIQNEDSSDATYTLQHTISDKDNNEIYSLRMTGICTPGLNIKKQTITVADAVLWDIDEPYLYSLRTELVTDKYAGDYDRQAFGFRTIEFTPDKGLYLNGRNITINGSCEHHTLGALGAAINRTALRRQLESLQRMGVNAVRSAHNMPSAELLELCDEMGILLYTESFDMWEHCKTDYDYGNYFKEWWKKDVTSWVRQDRNHPCVFIWGIGNEIHDINYERGLAVTRMLRDAVRELDYYNNAFIAMGSNIMGSDCAQKCSDEVDLVGYNYMENLYDEHHEKYPDWCIFGSETSSTLQSRGIYHFPLDKRLLTYDDGQCSSLGNCTTNWGAKNTDAVITEHRDRKYCFGQFIWTGWDYIGEPTPYFTKNSYFGQVDTAGFEKDSYYHYMAEWTDYKDNPMIHLLPYWDFNEGQIIDVRVFSNAPKVELFLNGISQGCRVIDHAHGKTLAGDWRLSYTPGVLKAVAYDENDNIIADTVQRSFGDAKKITLHPDRDTVPANGEDLLFVEINTLDENDVFVANSRSRVHVSVTGAGRLVGLDNGDSTDFEQYKGTSRRLFSGRLLAVIAAGTEPGIIHIEVSSPALDGAVMDIEAVPSIVRKGISCIAENRETYPEKSDEIPVRKISLTCQGARHMDKTHPRAVVHAGILPENATFNELHFKAVTADGVESRSVKIDVTDNTAALYAVGDGSFRLLCTCNNGTGVPEVISELEFEVTGMGEATHDPYRFVNGIDYSDCTSDAKLSFQGGVYITSEERTRFLFENVDFGEYGATDIHIPIFSFEDELPVEVWLGDSQKDGKLLVKDCYRAKSMYNHYQENVYSLPERIKGVQSVSIVVYPSVKLSLQGFYCTRHEKAYGLLYAAESNSISGDAYSVKNECVENIGNNVTLQFNNMDFGDDGPSQITICGRSSIPVNTIHIRFTDENDTETAHMAEFTGSEGFQQLTFPVHGFKGNGHVDFIFMPGSRFDFKWFQFS